MKNEKLLAVAADLKNLTTKRHKIEKKVRAINKRKNEVEREYELLLRQIHDTNEALLNAATEPVLRHTPFSFSAS